MFEGIFRRKRKDAEFKSEIEAHLQLEEERLREQGVSPEEAHTRAYRAFGNVTKTQERFYESGRWMRLDNLWRDVRYAARMLRKSPSFTVAAILTLAMAISANVLVFAVMNALVLHPLHLHDEPSLYLVEQSSDRSGNKAYPDYIDLRDRNHSFDGLAASGIASVGLDSGQGASLTWGWEVSGNYFDVMGVQPQLGRFFQPADERGPNSAPYLVLSYKYWHARFQNDPNVIGRIVQLNKHPFTIIGVTPQEFHGSTPIVQADFYAPIVDTEWIDGTNHINARDERWVQYIIGRVKQGVVPARAVADLNSIGAGLARTYPKTDQKMSFVLEHPTILGGHDDIFTGLQAFLAGLMLLAGLILLAACANLGGLFAARAQDRSREIAMRLALGSSRARILRQLFTEAILLSLAGGAVGIWASSLMLGWLSNWQPLPRYPAQFAVNPDATVYVVAFLLAIISGLLFGAVPVRQVLRTNPYGVIKSGAMTAPGRRITARDLLLGAQIAICAVLVTSSFVAVRGLVRSMSSKFGIQPQNALLVDVDLGMAGYRGDQVAVMQKKILDAMAGIPGVQNAGLVFAPPATLDCCSDSLVFTDRTTDLRDVNAALRSDTLYVSPRYFQAAGTVLLSGRAFSETDDKNAPRVAIVNQYFARKVFGSGTKALGGYFKLPDGTRVQVVGIVEDGKYASATEAPQAALFRPILQVLVTEAWLVLRAQTAGSQQLALAVRSKLRSLDPGLVSYAQTWDNALNQMLFPSRMAAIALGVLGMMGALLCVTGIFGMAAYAVSKRKRELGIRVALGARRKEVLQAALGRAVKLLAFGSALGLILGILASRVLAAIVYEATPRDPFVLTGVVLAMMLVGLLATWIPAQRALSIDPAALLREE